MKYILLFFGFILPSAVLFPQTGGNGYAAESVLRTGKWHKMKLTEEGIYRISFSRLRDLGFTDPSRVKVYGNNAGQLSYYNNGIQADDLEQIAIYTEKGADGIFNEGDHIYFYAMGTHRWGYDKDAGNYYYIRHNYSDTAVYFLTESPGNAIKTGAIPVSSAPADYTTQEYDILFIHEQETENIIKSGREWYQPLSVIRGTDIKPGFTRLVQGEPLRYKLRVVGRSPVPAMFRLLSEEETMVSLMTPEVNIFNTTGTYARYAESEGLLPYSASPGYEIKFYNNGEPGASGWLDYITLHGRSELIAGDKALIFSDSRSTGPGLIKKYRIKSSSASLNVWDITNPHRPSVVETSYDGGFISFTVTADSLKRFVVFTPQQALSPAIGNPALDNQNLHAMGPCDMLIISHPLFLGQAERLASLHFSTDGLISRIVTPGQVYNEFSGGVPDVCAIRNFVRMMWQKHSSSDHHLKYLLLFGDGSYDNKSLPPSNPNFIPTWQSQNSNIIVSSFTSDDFYGLLDPEEGESSGYLDIGIGRLPAYDTLTARILVDKIYRYINGTDPGNWRNIITFAADDEDGNLHMADAENLALYVSGVNPDVNIEKIYFDAFRQETSVNGQSYPEATVAIKNRIENGTLIFNYLGHGNELGLAHERVVKTSDINGWNNLSRLPLLITATCEFSRFDDIEYNLISGVRVPKNSAGELALLSPSGGAIALMSTTRVVFSAPNYVLNRNIFSYAFEKGSDGLPLRLGDIIRFAKISSGSGANKRSFLLLGDPALKLAYPNDAVVVTDSINSRHVSLPGDTLKALSEITIAGHLTTPGGARYEGFSGTLHATIYDKPALITTLANDGGTPFGFPLMNSILFSGKTLISDGMFKFSFMVPRDIDYAYGQGKISYYANDGGLHGSGSFNNIVVGGFSTRIANDTRGPEIRLFLNDTLFRSGSVAGSNPVLLALLSDENGINTTGAGIGHDITLWLNDDRNSSIVVNNLYETDFGDYRKGMLRYPLNGLSEGHYSITLKAWDNYNNSNQATLLFVVGNDFRFIVSDIINYPNPFTSSTAFVAGHNRSDSDITVEIDIFDLSGKEIRKLRSVASAGSYSIGPVLWDGTDADGSKAAPGIYIFRVTLTTGKGETASGSGKLIIL